MTTSTNGPAALEIRLAGENALVTGAATGIGRATALRLGTAGARVVVHHHPSQVAAAGEVVQEIERAGGRAVALGADLIAIGELPQFVQAAEQAVGAIDLLINNAAVFPAGPILETDLGVWQEALTVNVTAPFALTQLVCRRLLELERPGRVVMISSYNATWAAPDMVAYAVTKSALAMLAKGMARELSHHGILVNCVVPAGIQTPANRLWESPERRAQIPWFVPLGRMGSPDEVASIVLFLCSEAASFVAGASWEVDGGITTSKR